MRGRPGRPIVRGAELRRRDRMPNKRMPAAERQRDSRRTGCHSKAAVAGNRPDAGPSGRARKGADVGR